jgi:hypothetical protein
MTTTTIRRQRRLPMKVVRPKRSMLTMRCSGWRAVLQFDGPVLGMRCEN